MHFFSIFLAAASFAGALAGPCAFSPGTNISDSFSSTFTLEVVDAATGSIAPLNLGAVVTQLGITWSVLQVSIAEFKHGMCTIMSSFQLDSPLVPAIISRDSFCKTTSYLGSSPELPYKRALVL